MKKRLWLALIICCSLVLFGIRFFVPGGKNVPVSPLSSQNITMKITADFQNNGLMPISYTCDGEGRFPSLTVEEIPVETQALVLIVDDPDAPAGTWNHLLLANIPVDNAVITISQNTFDTAIFGQNSRGDLARGAPCPPGGTHRYVFKIYALSQKLEISSGFHKDRLVELMGGRVLAQGELVGLYTRK